MKRVLLMGGMAILLASTSGCATTKSSAQEQHQALVHQQKSDEAAKAGLFGVAADEQSKAASSHNRAVFRAIKEGTPIPAQTKAGDAPPAPPPLN